MRVFSPNGRRRHCSWPGDGIVQIHPRRRRSLRMKQLGYLPRREARRKIARFSSSKKEIPDNMSPLGKEDLCETPDVFTLLQVCPQDSINTLTCMRSRRVRRGSVCWLSRNPQKRGSFTRPRTKLSEPTAFILSTSTVTEPSTS